jgi:hypothetical protein
MDFILHTFGFAEIVSGDFHYSQQLLLFRPANGNKEPNSDAVPKFYVEAIAPFA